MDKSFNNSHEIRFMTHYIQQRLEYYEHLEFSQHTHEKLVDIGQEASSIRKYALDVCDEGYGTFIDRVVQPINALKRLDQFIGRLMGFLGETSERRLFCLYPQAIDLTLLHSPKFDGDITVLNVLLESIEQQAENPVDIDDCFNDPRQKENWKAKTTILLNEIMNYLSWTLAQYRQEPSNTLPVFLLRDTLFLYLGYRKLFRRGQLPAEPQPVLLNRNFIIYTEGSEEPYLDVIVSSIYEALFEHPKDASIFYQLFCNALHKKETPFSLQKETRAYLKSLVGSQPIFIVESGYHGSMPLWILCQCGNSGKFVLYTTTPWLYKVYAANTFTRCCNYLRDMETSVAQNFLFQFQSVENDQILVSKTNNPLIEKLARYELHLFYRMLEKLNIK